MAMPSFLRTLTGVLPWTETGYSFVEREGSDGLAWAALRSGQDAITTASSPPARWVRSR
jgi:hypothetical protein